MMLVLALGAAVAAQPAEPVQRVAPSSFDLPVALQRASRDHAAPLVPQHPRNLDTRDFPPEAELRLAVDGPVLAIGAMGGRRSGRPKLAHVALDWSF